MNTDDYRSEALNWLQRAKTAHDNVDFPNATRFACSQSAATIALAYATLAGPPTTTISTSRTGAPTT